MTHQDQLITPTNLNITNVMVSVSIEAANSPEVTFFILSVRFFNGYFVTDFFKFLFQFLNPLRCATVICRIAMTVFCITRNLIDVHTNNTLFYLTKVLLTVNRLFFLLFNNS